MIADKLELVYTGEHILKLRLTDNPLPKEMLNNLKRHADEVGKLEVIIKPYRKKQSLDANAYLWVLANKIAEQQERSTHTAYR